MELGHRPVTLIIIDGWGIEDDPKYSARARAKTPFYDSLIAGYPHTALACSGLDVGLPEGQMGNSEVGHLNIGAGRIVYQDYTRINLAVKDGSLFMNPVLAGAMDAAKATGGALHLLGLLSDGGVHSDMEHLYALLEMARGRGLDKVFVHAFLDGRDTPPSSGQGYVHELVDWIRAHGMTDDAYVSLVRPFDDAINAFQNASSYSNLGVIYILAQAARPEGAIPSPVQTVPLLPPPTPTVMQLSCLATTDAPPFLPLGTVEDVVMSPAPMSSASARFIISCTSRLFIVPSIPPAVSCSRRVSPSSRSAPL